MSFEHEENPFEKAQAWLDGQLRLADVSEEDIQSALGDFAATYEQNSDRDPMEIARDIAAQYKP